jgi:hypothetical protein
LGADTALAGHFVEGGEALGRQFGGAVQGAAGDAAQRAPRQEGEAQLGAEAELGVAVAYRGGVLVLDRDQSVAEDRAGPADLVGVRVGEADQPDLALVEELAQGADRILERNGGVGLVELLKCSPS